VVGRKLVPAEINDDTRQLEHIKKRFKRNEGLGFRFYPKFRSIMKSCDNLVESIRIVLFLNGIQMMYAKLIKGHFMSLAYVICMPSKIYSKGHRQQY
jgi:hypothetical protein